MLCPRGVADKWKSWDESKVSESSSVHCSRRYMGSPKSLWEMLYPLSIYHLYFWPWSPQRRTLTSASKNSGIASEPSVPSNSV